MNAACTQSLPVRHSLRRTNWRAPSGAASSIPNWRRCCIPLSIWAVASCFNTRRACAPNPSLIPFGAGVSLLSADSEPGQEFLPITLSSKTAPVRNLFSRLVHGKQHLPSKLPNKFKAFKFFHERLSSCDRNSHTGGFGKWTPNGIAITHPDGGVLLYSEHDPMWKSKTGKGLLDPRDHICWEKDERGEWFPLCGYRAEVMG